MGIFYRGNKVQIVKIVIPDYSNLDILTVEKTGDVYKIKTCLQDVKTGEEYSVKEQETELVFDVNSAIKNYETTLSMRIVNRMLPE